MRCRPIRAQPSHQCHSSQSKEWTASRHRSWGTTSSTPARLRHIARLPLQSRLPLTGAFFIQEKQLKSAFLSPKGPWLLVLAALVFFACLVAIQASPATTAAWPYWPAVTLALQAVAVVTVVLLLCHAFKVDVTIEAEKGTGSGTTCSYSYSSDSGNLASSAEMHRKSLELQAIHTVVQAALLNGQSKAGEMARAAIDQLLGTGSLEYAKAALDESARPRASINQAFAAMQTCTCTGNEACSNCPPQRFIPCKPHAQQTKKP